MKTDQEFKDEVAKLFIELDEIRADDELRERYKELARRIARVYVSWMSRISYETAKKYVPQDKEPPDFWIMIARDVAQYISDKKALLDEADEAAKSGRVRFEPGESDAYREKYYGSKQPPSTDR